MRAISIKSASAWSGETADRVVLDYDDRHRRRMTMTGAKGTSFLLDLPTATGLRGGDALVLEDGRLIEVVAAAEPLLEIRCTDPLHLARVAWHLGNRHLPTQIGDAVLRIRPDHVIEAMLEGFGASLVTVRAPFQPEGGAYGSHAGQHHVHSDASGHHHEQ
jgi:urease accessory protein